MDTVRVDLSEILDTERLQAALWKAILFVGPGEIRDIDIKFAFQGNILHILLNALKCPNNIVSAKTIYV